VQFFLPRREAGVASWRRRDVRACRVWVCRTRIAAFNRAPSADKKIRFLPGSLTRCKFIFKIFNLALAPPWCKNPRQRKNPAAPCLPCSGLQSRGTSSWSSVFPRSPSLSVLHVLCVNPL